MKINTVKQALAEGKVQLGCSFGQLRSIDVTRILAAAGFDWVFVDCEHGGFDFSTVQDVCRMADNVGLCAVVRVADLEYSLDARSLDVGAQGIMFPRVESPELLEKAVSWTKFPPAGVRGYGLTPIHVDHAKASLPEIIAHKNAHTLVVLQIETARGVEARDEILSVPGIDAVMIGPADLSISLGVPGQFEHPKMIAAMEQIRDTCNAKGIAPGTQTRTLALAKFWKERGMRFLGCSSEAGMLLERGSEVVRELR